MKSLTVSPNSPLNTRSCCETRLTALLGMSELPLLPPISFARPEVPRSGVSKGVDVFHRAATGSAKARKRMAGWLRAGGVVLALFLGVGPAPAQVPGPLRVTGTASLATVGAESALAPDGGFDRPDGWTTGPKWSIAGSKAAHQSPDAEKAPLRGATRAAAGALYQVKVTVTDRSAGSLAVALGAANAGVAFDANGSQTAYIQTQAASPELMLAPSADFDGSVDGIGVFPVNPATPDGVISSSDGPLAPLEIYAGGANQKSMYLGSGCGRFSLAPAIHNTGLGHEALWNNTEGIQNTAIGYWALHVNTTGSANTAVGNGALDGNLVGNNNSAYSHHSLYRNINGDNNNAFGYMTLTNSNGDGNSAFGHQALAGPAHPAPNIGSRGSAFGMYAALLNASANETSAFGFSALKMNTAGDGNAAFGSRALENATGNYGTAVGKLAGTALTTGAANTFVGYAAGSGETPAHAPATDDYGILIGYHANRSVPTGTKLSNYVGIGAGVLVDASDQVKIGNPRTVRTDLYGHLEFGGNAPTLSACGTGPSAVTGTDVGGSFTMGSGNPTSCTLTFSAPWKNPPSCIANNQTTGTAVRVSALTTTGFTVTLAAGESGDVMNYLCVGRF